MCARKEKRAVRQFYGLGNFDGIPVKVQTDAGPQESKLKGQILLLIKKLDRGTEIFLKRLDLTADSVECKKGKSGLLSLGLVRGSEKVFHKDGKIQMEFKMSFHYPLITKIHGYRPQKEEEKDNFIPYVDTVKGVLKGEFEPSLDTVLGDIDLSKKKPSLKLKLEADFSAEEYYVTNLYVNGFLVMAIAYAIENQLKIQPVFIRSDPTDPSPTGWSFETLMRAAKCMWRKCCIHLNVLEPVFVDDASYKEIGSLTEAQNLMNKVDVDDAVEVFVADRMTTALYRSWGGGASFDSGTANAKIVSCDAQLRVPDPSDGSLGAINYNHLAHELGHSMSLRHPGAAATPPMVAATANTVMEPSGFYADNPHPQSQYNCVNADSPLFKWLFVPWGTRCVSNPEIV